MTVLETTGRYKLPVWRTVRACYATVLQNLRQLVRISWLWLMIMIPVYAALHWLVTYLWTDLELAMAIATLEPPWLANTLLQAMDFSILLPFVVELPFLASIAVAWHRLVLRDERVSAPAYLGLHRAIWVYAACSLMFLALPVGPLLLTGFFLVHYIVPQDALSIEALVAALVLVNAVILSLLLRLLLVLPAIALGERLSLRAAWRATRDNALRLALATVLCMLPAIFLLLLPSVLSTLLTAPRWLGLSWDSTLKFMWAWRSGRDLLYWLTGTLGYFVFESLAYALLTIFAVTLLSLAYRFFTAPREVSQMPAG